MQRGALRHVFENPAIDVPNKTRGKGKLNACGDPARSRDLRTYGTDGSTISRDENGDYTVTDGEDSFSFLSVLHGKDDRFDRAPVIHHSVAGMFAIREGRWKLVAGNGSGGRAPAGVAAR